jgi:carboxymethylenebutenolidase
MSSEWIDIQTSEGVANAYLSHPEDGQDHPGVLLLMDAFGLRPRIEQMADRIAAQGYVVLAPNVFYRAGRKPVDTDGIHDPERRGEVFQKIMPLMRELIPERIAADGDAYLRRLEEVARGPMVLTGYCMGGRLGWRIAAAHPDRVAALGAFHTAGLVTEGQDSPHRSADRLQAELYFGFADEDPNATPEQIATLEHALDDAGVTYRSEVYEGAAHGYTMSDTPAYDEAAAERHFRELFGLLERTVAA